MLSIQSIPASLEYILLITLYTIHTIADVLKWVSKAPKAIRFKIREHRHNEQKKKDNSCWTKLHSDKNTETRVSDKVTGNQQAWNSNGHRAFYLYFTDFNLIKDSSDRALPHPVFTRNKLVVSFGPQWVNTAEWPSTECTWKIRKNISVLRNVPWGG